MADVEERVAVVEQRVDGLEKWRGEHCEKHEREGETLSKLPTQIAVLVARVELLVTSEANLWRLVRWLVIALIAIVVVLLGAERLLPTILKGGL